MASHWNPQTRAFENRDQSGSAPYLSATVNDPGSASSVRAAIIDRLGLPSNATNEQALQALDAKLADKRKQTAEDALYAAAFGTPETGA